MSLVVGRDGKARCFWVGTDKPIYEKYHDEEWGKPVYDDRLLFEMLILEGAQAGLSWYTILKRRDGYRKAFYNFDVVKVAKMTDDELESLRNNQEIIRNKLKIYSARKNARVFIDIQREFGSFKEYLWGFVNEKPVVNVWENKDFLPSKSELSDRISKDLKKRGMSFVGSTIVYAYLQAVGVVNDHIDGCWLCKK